MSNKLTDTEITIKALKELLEVMLCEGDLQSSATISHAIDLINRLQARVEKCEKVEHFADKTIATLQAENERLKNAYEQCAWERDIFAEDMNEEIKKDCSYLMLDIKTIKAEAYQDLIDNHSYPHPESLTERIVYVSDLLDLLIEMESETNDE